MASTVLWTSSASRKSGMQARPVACASKSSATSIDLQVVEAQLMPRSRAKRSIRRMIGPGLDSGEARPWPVASIEMQFVHVFLAESQRTPGAGYLERQIHGPSGRGPIRLDTSGHAASETQQCMCRVIDLDRAQFVDTWRSGPHRMNCPAVAAQSLQPAPTGTSPVR